ncbi:MAG: rRNA pseudouridine synthase [Alphaproteobacteria bacterium]|nr:rRNA pseudouridine synthase [Alphaproteobacteria bacterium]
MKVRLAKFIADSGIASRRGAESLIKSGAVVVNGVVVDTPVVFVDENDNIYINGKKIEKQQEIELYMFHKPINTMTTTHDPMGRKTIYDVLDKKYKNLKYIGRLDFKTSGLLLMTNNGDFARKMSLPQNHVPRTYIATVDNFTESGLNIARRGVTIDNIKYRPMDIEFIDKNNLRVTVTEGKKNEIRIVFKFIKSPIIKLHRIQYGLINLGNLGVGKIKCIDKKTIDLMLKNL